MFYVFLNFTRISCDFPISSFFLIKIYSLVVRCDNYDHTDRSSIYFPRDRENSRLFIVSKNLYIHYGAFFDVSIVTFK